MRIAFISYEYPPDTAFGGIGTYVYNTARVLASRGHHVEVFAASHTRQEVYAEERVIIHRIIEEDRNHFGITVDNYFSKKQSENPFDVIEGPEFCGDSREISSKYPELPYVLCMHTPSKMSARLNNFTGYVDEIYKFLSDLIKIAKYSIGKNKGLKGIQSIYLNPYLWKQDRMEKKEARKADLIVAPSRDLYHYVQEKWGISPKKIYHLPHLYTPEKKMLDIQINNQNEKDPVNIGFIGRLQYRKGVSFLAKAIPLVFQKCPNVTFTFVGSILNEPTSGLPYDKWMESMLHQYNNQIHFKGPVPFKNIFAELQKLDIVVLPSVWENFPNTCLEAMSAGRAIVAGKHGGMSEMLNDGESGYLVDPIKPGELAGKIIDLVEQPEKRRNMGIKARERVLNQYNSDIIGLKKEKLYQKAIELSSYNNNV